MKGYDPSKIQGTHSEEMTWKRLHKWIRKNGDNAAWFACGALVVLGIIWGVMSVRHDTVALAFRNSPTTISWLPTTVARYDKQIQIQAKKYNIDAGVVAIIMTLESGGYDRADSGQAQGLMQVTPYTAKDIAAKYIKKPVATYDLFNEITNIEFGAAYLAQLRDTFCDSDMSSDLCVELIAAGYNGGPGAANSLFKGEGLSDVQTATYSRNAMNMWRERAVAKSPTYERWLAAGGQDLVDKASKSHAV